MFVENLERALCETTTYNLSRLGDGVARGANGNSSRTKRPKPPKISCLPLMASIFWAVAGQHCDTAAEYFLAVSELGGCRAFC